MVRRAVKNDFADGSKDNAADCIVVFAFEAFDQALAEKLDFFRCEWGISILL